MPIPFYILLINKSTEREGSQNDGTRYIYALFGTADYRRALGIPQQIVVVNLETIGITAVIWNTTGITAMIWNTTGITAVGWKYHIDYNNGLGIPQRLPKRIWNTTIGPNVH